jgi:Tol biopolymer transport system component
MRRRFLFHGLILLTGLTVPWLACPRASGDDSAAADHGARRPITMADLVGRYQEGMGSWAFLYSTAPYVSLLELNGDGTFSWGTRRDRDSVPPVPLTGRYSLEDGVAVLQYKNLPEKGDPSMLDPWEEPHRLVPVRWGQRLYLVRDRAMGGFCDLVIRGLEPRSSARGPFLLRAGDEGKRAVGAPHVPAEYADRVIAASILGEVTSVRDDGKFMLNVGRVHGVRVGMEFSKPWTLSHVVILSVSGKTCVAERADPNWNDDPITVGDLFLVGSEPQLSAANQARLRKQLRRLSAKPQKAIPPLSGSRIAYVSGTMYDSGDSIRVMRADGSGAAGLTGERVGGHRIYFSGHPSWSPNGTLIAFSTHGLEGSMGEDLAIVNADGTGLRRLTGMARRTPTWKAGRGTWRLCLDCQWPAWSPDGAKIAYSADGPVEGETGFYSQIYVVDADGSNDVRLTDEAAEHHCPAWSPDGSTIAFVSDHAAAGVTGVYGRLDIWLMGRDGDNLRSLGVVGRDPSIQCCWGPMWSPDGTRLAFVANRDRGSAHEGTGEQPQDIWVLELASGKLTRLTDAPAGEGEVANCDPSWSPDGSEIAFSSNRDGDWAIFVMNADGSDVRRISQPDTRPAKNLREFPYNPAWSPTR